MFFSSPQFLRMRTPCTEATRMTALGWQTQASLSDRRLRNRVSQAIKMRMLSAVRWNKRVDDLARVLVPAKMNQTAGQSRACFEQRRLVEQRCKDVRGDPVHSVAGGGL